MSPKTAKSRWVVPLPVWVGEVLVAQWLAIDDMRAQAQELWEEHDLLFPSEVGTPLDPSNINKQFHKALRSADLPSVRLHDLRHTFATLAFSQRISAREVQEILGHSTVTTTLATYTHVVPGVIRQAADQIGDLLMPDRGTEGSD